MANVLVYTSPARGHLYPLIPTLQELQRRGHQVHVRSLADEVPRLRALGFHATPMAAGIEARTLDDWKAKTPPAALGRALSAWLDRAEFELADVRDALNQSAADVVFVDVNSWGALAAAEASGVPFAVFSPYFLNMCVPGRPPFGMGLAPATGALGRLRDTVLWAVLRWMVRPHLRRLNSLRARLGLPPIPAPELLTSRAPRVVAYTAEPFEYAHGGWPANVRFVGPGIWEPESEPEAGAPQRPLVLVTCSTEFQDDGRLVAMALEALKDEDVDVIATTAAVDPASFGVPPKNARVVPFAAHGPLLRRAVAVVCHGGMGITQKALAAGVPVCVVPWGRDQNDVAQHVELAGAGCSVPKAKLTAARLREAVRETIQRRDGARRIAAAFASVGGAEAAADVLEELMPAGARASAVGG